MGTKQSHTIKALFRRFAISLIVLLAAAILTPILLQTAAVNMGFTTRANQSEIQAKAIIPTLEVAPDITKVVMPRGVRYLILDKEFNELYSNMDTTTKEAAISYAKGEYINQGSKQQFLLVVRENELCVLQYFIGSHFTVSWLPDFFPSPDTLMFTLIVVNSLLVIIVLTAEFAKQFRSQLHPLMEATKEISRQNLEFEVGHSKIKEFEDVLVSFSDMKENLRSSLEKQWKAKQMQREQITALAHDLKTPLTIIQGNADLISETDLDEEQRLYAKYIANSSEQMQKYIKTLIDISRAYTGYQFHMEQVDVSAFLRQIISLIDAMCKPQNVFLNIWTDNNISINIMADQSLLERAILNVVSNALDYAPKDSTLHFSVTKKNNCFEISVTDEGEGFPPEALLHAKEQFYMADRSRSNNQHFGMGLYIAESIIEQHNGTLILENSNVTGGAKVILSIPIKL